MENRELTPCQGFVEYMTGEMSDVERKRFERHLDGCPACREDAAEWWQVWDRLSEDAEPQELPSDLKNEVMGAIFGTRPDEVHPEPLRLFSEPRRHGNALRRLLAAAVLIAAFAAGFIGREWFASFTPASTPIAAAPSQIQQLYRLNPAMDTGREYLSSKNAYGVACIVNHDQEQRLIVYVFGAAKTVGNEAYHVWLLNNETRSSAGTFTVDATGIGLLSLPWTNDATSFDQIGITLEPSADTDAPHGPKVFGSAAAAG